MSSDNEVCTKCMYASRNHSVRTLCSVLYLHLTFPTRFKHNMYILIYIYLFLSLCIQISTGGQRHPPTPQRRRTLVWLLYIVCFVWGATFLNSFKEDELKLRTENTLLKEYLGSITVPRTIINVGGDSLKDRVATLELLTQKLSVNVTGNVQAIEGNVDMIQTISKKGDTNAMRGTANTGLITTNTQEIASNANGIASNANRIANQTVALANVTASILNIIGNDIDAAVAVEVPIVVARSLGNITLALQAVQMLLAKKMSSAELVFEKVEFSFPASAKPDQNGLSPLQQCYTRRGGQYSCCLLGGPPIMINNNMVPCGSVSAAGEATCPLFCNATITCPQGSAPVASECAGNALEDSEEDTRIFLPNATVLANGLHRVTCMDPQYMATIAALEHRSDPLSDDDHLSDVVSNRMSTFCVSLKTSTSPNTTLVT